MATGVGIIKTRRDILFGKNAQVGMIARAVGQTSGQTQGVLSMPRRLPGRLCSHVGIATSSGQDQ